MASSLHVLRELFNIAQTHPQKVALVLDDQVWTYGELVEKLECVAYHLNNYNIVQGQIVYQFVERGFGMICGLLGIMYVGGVYCPLNPTEPYDRIVVLLEQIQAQHVLLHGKTRDQFPTETVQHVISLDTILVPSFRNDDMYDLPACNGCGPAYIICTSGTTGRPKIVVHTHRTFAAGIRALSEWHLGVYTFRDQILQVSTCSWVLHLYEVALSLVLGGSLICLQPGGHLDMSYFCKTLSYQQVTTLVIGPSLIRALTNYLEMSNQLETFKFVRNLVVGGYVESSIYFGNCVFFY
jgi:acyl-coenzyme A synthetase/AMP-(fatty) acid ligase